MSTLYVSDLDGTLLTNAAALSDYSKRELEQLLMEGIAFSVASARSVIAIRTILDGLALRLPVIEFNGAFISDLETGRHRVVNDLDSSVAIDVYDTISKRGHVPLISTFNGTEDCLYHSEILNAGTQWYVDDRKRHKDRRLRRTENIPAVLREKVVCITSIGTREELDPLAAEIVRTHSGKVEVHLFENRYSPSWFWLTVHDVRASKEQAVQALMDMEGLNGRDLVVFGDEVNDLKLFAAASESVAVANAVPAVRDRARHVIGTNEEDSVVRFIRKHWNERITENAV